MRYQMKRAAAIATAALVGVGAFSGSALAFRRVAATQVRAHAPNGDISGPAVRTSPTSRAAAIALPTIPSIPKVPTLQIPTFTVRTSSVAKPYTPVFVPQRPTAPTRTLTAPVAPGLSDLLSN